MADFKKAYKKTAIHEGGYVNDPDDPGRETYKGISRRSHPSWKGWTIIDKRKKEDNEHFPDNLETSSALRKQVKSLYKAHYWDRFWGDDISSQKIVDELFDTGVNQGISRAVLYLQEGLNLLNRNKTNYPDIAEDGDFGRETFRTLESHLEQENHNASYLLKILNLLQGMKYIEIMRRSPSQEKYARGWLKRVKLSG